VIKYYEIIEAGIETEIYNITLESVVISSVDYMFIILAVHLQTCTRWWGFDFVGLNGIMSEGILNTMTHG
jgi:hypothetical protein